MTKGLVRKMIEEAARMLAEKDPSGVARWLARHEFCDEQGLQYYGLYTMPQVAERICDVSGKSIEDIDFSSIKRWTKPGPSQRLGFTKHGVDGKRIFGYQIADFYLDNIVSPKWDGIERRKSSKSGNGSSGKSPARSTGTAAATTVAPDKQLVSRLASET